MGFGEIDVRSKAASLRFGLRWLAAIAGLQPSLACSYRCIQGELAFARVVS